MTFTISTSGQRDASQEAVETAEEAATKVDEAQKPGEVVKVHIYSEADDPSDLTRSERLIIEKEGQSAASDGRDSADCPYTEDEQRRRIWMDGYNS